MFDQPFGRQPSTDETLKAIQTAIESGGYLLAIDLMTSAGFVPGQDVLDGAAKEYADKHPDAQPVVFEWYGNRVRAHSLPRKF